MTLIQRLVRVGRASDVHGQMVELIRQSLSGFDAEHLRYVVERQILLWEMIPQPLNRAAMGWLLPKAKIMASITPEELLKAVQEARPDIADLWRGAAARQWLHSMFGDVPFPLKLIL